VIDYFREVLAVFSILSFVFRNFQQQTIEKAQIYFLFNTFKKLEVQFQHARCARPRPGSRGQSTRSERVWRVEWRASKLDADHTKVISTSFVQSAYDT